MKKIFLALVAAAVLFTAAAVSFCNCCTANAAVVSNYGDDKASVMTLTVKSIVENETEAKNLQASLKKLEGVSEVDYCTKSGTVTVKYIKSKLGCCSKIHSALKDGNVNYELVSNVENPSCSKSSKKGCEGKKACSKSKES